MEWKRRGNLCGDGKMQRMPSRACGELLLLEILKKLSDHTDEEKGP
jgi:hypothetical protein